MICIETRNNLLSEPLFLVEQIIIYSAEYLIFVYDPMHILNDLLHGPAPGGHGVLRLHAISGLHFPP
jgi:hypothetical protein